MEEANQMMRLMQKFHTAEDHRAGFRPEGAYASRWSDVRRALESQPEAEGAWRRAGEWVTRCDELTPKIPPDEVSTPQKRQSEYSLRTRAKPRGDEADYMIYPTRTIASLDGFSGSLTTTDRWGGDREKNGTKTGFFHLEYQNGRWLMIDPDGCHCYMAGITAVSSGFSPNAHRNALKKFGSLDEWASQTIGRLKELGFTSAGMWSDNDHLAQTGKPFGLCGTLNFLRDYAQEKGLADWGVGHVLFKANNTLPVFDPEFERFAEAYAQEHAAPHAADEELVGWFSDNELPTMYNLLERCLTLDPAEPENLYTLTAAWAFLKKGSHKDDPSLEDVTPELLERFRGVIYERYFSVVASALKNADPNHLYLGCRFSYLGKQYREGTALAEPILRAAGRWCDIVSINYYFAWEPDAGTVQDWVKWSGRPFMISEWYAMSVDSGLKCVTGAGFKVPSQKERAAFYQNFALWLLECPWCAGFHWFMYMDNDPANAAAEASNKNGNKGIVTVSYQEWTELTGAMQELNLRIPSLLRWFDERNRVS